MEINQRRNTARKRGPAWKKNEKKTATGDGKRKRIVRDRERESTAKNRCDLLNRSPPSLSSPFRLRPNPTHLAPQKKTEKSFQFGWVFILFDNV